MKKIEKLLLKAYRMGQDSVTYMKIIPNGDLKPTNEETSTTEDEMLILIQKENK